MDLVSELESAKTGVLDDAAERLARSHLAHYDAAGAEQSRLRLEALFDIVVTCLRSRELGPIAAHAEQLAHERFEAGFDIGELQTAFNVLEESIWLEITSSIQPEELVEALGLVTTVLGVGKDALARTYVSLASREHVTSLDLRAMFEGTGG